MLKTMASLVEFMDKKSDDFEYHQVYLIETFSIYSYTFACKNYPTRHG